MFRVVRVKKNELAVMRIWKRSKTSIDLFPPMHFFIGKKIKCINRDLLFDVHLIWTRKKAPLIIKSTVQLWCSIDVRMEFFLFPNPICQMPFNCSDPILSECGQLILMIILIGSCYLISRPSISFFIHFLNN